MNTVTVGIVITATLEFETTARKQNLCKSVNTHIGFKLSSEYYIYNVIVIKYNVIVIKLIILHQLVETK